MLRSTAFRNTARRALSTRPQRAVQTARLPLRAFSVQANGLRKDGGNASKNLSTVLSNELKFSKEEVDSSAGDEDIQQFLKESGFKVQHQIGSQDIELVRSSNGFDNEEFDEEAAENQEPGAEEDEEMPVRSTPISTSVGISKAGAPGALIVDATVQDNVFVFENIAHYDDKKVAFGKDVESQFQRSARYQGSPFETLDEELQETWEKYMESHGINADLASFISTYIGAVESQEYHNWLKNVKHFVDAK